MDAVMVDVRAVWRACYSAERTASGKVGQKGTERAGA